MKTLSAAVAVAFAATGITLAPTASSATVLATEGLLQRSGKTQTAFQGAFCEANTCRSVNNYPTSISRESDRLQVAVEQTSGDLILLGWSHGAATVIDRVQEWEADPALAPAGNRVKLVVTYGNPWNPYGGSSRNENRDTAIPANPSYEHLDVTMQYDSVADKPTRWGWYSMINTAMGRHFDYFDEGVDIDDPTNLVYREGNSTYMLIEADVLPMLKWRAWFTSEERMTELDAKYRPLVEADYDRPDYVEQGQGADWGNGNPPPSVEPEIVQEKFTEEKIDEGNFNDDPAALGESSESDGSEDAEGRGGMDDEPQRSRGNRVGERELDSDLDKADEDSDDTESKRVVKRDDSESESEKSDTEKSESTDSEGSE